MKNEKTFETGNLKNSTCELVDCVSSKEEMGTCKTGSHMTY